MPNAVYSAHATYLRPEQVVDHVESISRELRGPVLVLVRWDGEVSVRPEKRVAPQDIHSCASIGYWRYPFDRAHFLEVLDDRIAEILAGWIR